MGIAGSGAFGHRDRISNAIVASLFQVFGTTVRTGAIRHSQSQGAAERFNRTLLILIRKTLANSADRKQDLKLLLYYYNTRPHGSTNLPPMETMFGWQPRSFIVNSPDTDLLLSEWVIRLSKRSAAIRDYIEEEFSRRDFVSDPSKNPYRPDDPVQLLRPDRHQKCSAPYEPGWQVVAVISSSTVRIRRSIDDHVQEKVVNVDLLKADKLADVLSSSADPDVQSYNLRSRSTLERPGRYS